MYNTKKVSEEFCKLNESEFFITEDEKLQMILTFEEQVAELVKPHEEELKKLVKKNEKIFSGVEGLQAQISHCLSMEATKENVKITEVVRKAQKSVRVEMGKKTTEEIRKINGKASFRRTMDKIYTEEAKVTEDKLQKKADKLAAEKKAAEDALQQEREQFLKDNYGGYGIQDDLFKMDEAKWEFHCKGSKMLQHEALEEICNGRLQLLEGIKEPAPADLLKWNEEKWLEFYNPKKEAWKLRVKQAEDKIKAAQGKKVETVKEKGERRAPEKRVFVGEAGMQAAQEKAAEIERVDCEKMKALKAELVGVVDKYKGQFKSAKGRADFAAVDQQLEILFASLEVK